MFTQSRTNKSMESITHMPRVISCFRSEIHILYLFQNGFHLQEIASFDEHSTVLHAQNMGMVSFKHGHVKTSYEWRRPNG